MVRSPSIDKNGLRRGEWSKEEDDKLKAYIYRYGHWNWRQLPQFAGMFGNPIRLSIKSCQTRTELINSVRKSDGILGLSRCGKSCRLRWKNYLQPNVKRGNYTKDEEDIIINLHNQLGKKWSVIAKNLPGRTDNEIKNYWHTHLKKRTQEQNLKEKVESSESSADFRSQELMIEDYESTRGSSCSELSVGCSDATNLSVSVQITGFEEDTTFDGLDDFWNQPFETDYNYMINAYKYQQQLMDPPPHFYPSSPIHEEVSLWSYEI